MTPFSSSTHGSHRLFRTKGVKILTVVYRILHACFLGLFFLTYLYLSQEPLYQVRANTFSTSMPPQSIITTTASTVSSFSRPFLISSGYGLFRMMTGVSQEPPHVGAVGVSGAPPSIVSRPEIQIEGYDASTNSWKTVPFSYKPSGAFHSPRFVAPHQPRLDWQMWFAALSDYSHQPWFIHLIHKLLQGGDYSADVVKLLDSYQYSLLFPEPNGRPLYVRARLFHLDFTRNNNSWVKQQCALEKSILAQQKLQTERKQPWWYETFVTEYTPALERDNGSVKAFLEGNGIISRYAQNENQKLKHCFHSAMANNKTGESDSSDVRNTVSSDPLGVSDKLIFLLHERLQYLVCNSLNIRKYLL